jgi:hypothetical protein
MGQASKVVRELELCKDHVLIKQATSTHSRRRETYLRAASSGQRCDQPAWDKGWMILRWCKIIINALPESYDGFIDSFMGQDELPKMDKLTNELLFEV